MSDVLDGLDPELARRVKVVLMNLSMLTEGKASAPHSLAPPAPRERHECPRCNGKGCPRCKNRGTLTAEARHRSVQAHHESSIPAGVNIDRKATEAPSKDDSLYDHYLWMFGRALRLKDEEQIRTLCFSAERDWVKAIGRPSEDPRERLMAQRRLILADTGKEPTEDELMESVVRLYVGYSKQEAALIEKCSVGFIEKARSKHRRNAEDGRLRRGWDGWDDERRHSEVAKLRSQGWTQARIAGELGVVERTVQRYWGDRARAA